MDDCEVTYSGERHADARYALGLPPDHAPTVFCGCLAAEGAACNHVFWGCAIDYSERR